MLNKFGSKLKILKTAASATDVLTDDFLVEKPKQSKILEAKNPDFLYYRARAISAGDFGPINKDGSRDFNYNGNYDFFSRAELEKSYHTFLGRNIFLDHNSSSSLYSIGKIIDAVPVDDPETGEFYIELVGKIDRTLHPEICRKIQTGELNSTSMGCSVDESICSICGNVLHSDADEKCEHMGMNLGKKFPAEVDFPEYNIKKGDMVPCFSINKGIVFNEDSIVGVPADSSAVIKTVLSNMKSRMNKKASLTKEEQVDLASQMEKLFSKLDEETRVQLKADLANIFAVSNPVSENLCKCAHIEKDHSPLLRCLNANCNCTLFNKESSMTDKNITPNDEQKKILSKISALEMEQLESYVMGKTKKATEIVNKEIVADSVAKEESFLQKVIAKVKEALSKDAKKCPECDYEICNKKNCACEKCHPGTYGKEGQITAKFNENKNNILASTWSVYEGGKLILDASLKDIWGSQFELLSFADQEWATSEDYAKEIVSRYQKEGLAKLAYLWDVEHKISKTASEPKLGPTGPRAKPSTGTSNKEHDIKNTPVTKPGQEQAQKGPAAPAHQDVKTQTKLDMPGQEVGQKGPAAPRAKEVKTDYSDPKPEAGTEVKTTPKNPDEKDAEKSMEGVKTDYVAAGTEAMEAEEKAEKKSSLISWSSLTPVAQTSIKKAAKNYIAAGMKNAEAVAKAHSEFIKVQETNMKKQAADKPMESVDGSTLPESKKKFDAMPDESVQGSTVPEEGKSKSPETSAQGDKEHKTPNLTKAPDQAVDGNTISHGDKDEESVEKSVHPSGKKEMGDKADMAVKAASKSETSAPIEAVQDKPELSKKTMGDKADVAVENNEQIKGTNPKQPIDEAVKKEAAAIPCGDCGKPYDADKGEWCEECMVKHMNKAKPVTNTKPSPLPESRASKEAATEMPMPEDKPAIEEDVVVDDVKPMDMPVENKPVEEVSAFDTTEKVDIGEGYSAHKDLASKEVVIEKDGKEVKRLPDGFGKDMAAVLPLMKAVLGLPMEEMKPEMPAAVAPVDEKKEEVVEEQHPALEEAHEDELGMKESALKQKEAELLKKEAALKAIEEKVAKEEASKKFASILKARSERCKQIVANMVDKNALKMDTETYETEIKSGTYLLDAQKKAFEVAINAKHKELLAMDDLALKAMEKAIEEIPAAPVNTKRASKLFISPEYHADLSGDEFLAKIFNTMGDSKQRPQ